MELAEQECVPCRGDVPPFGEAESAPLLRQLDGWKIDAGQRLIKTYKFPDFQSALAFTNRVGELAEEQGHHPDIHLSWGAVRLEIWTHSIGGLSQSDFVLAAKCDRLPH